MAFYNSETLLKKADSRIIKKSYGGSVGMSINEAKNFLNEERSFSFKENYDIFLSHSIEDDRIVYELKMDLQNKGFSVYIDWIDDPELDRSNVTVATANKLRRRIRSCKSVVYALSELSKKSSWVQWELGYADGQKNGRVGILPIMDTIMRDRRFYRQEYLGLYPYIDGTSLVGKQFSR